MEWLLLFIPLDLFEKGLQQLGADAKEVALVGTFVGMAVVLAVVGAFTLRAGWPSLVAARARRGHVAVLDGRGDARSRAAACLGNALLISPLLTSAGYLLVFLGYASVLVGGRLLLRQRAVTTRRSQPQPVMAERRAFMAGAIGALLAAGTTWFAGREGGLVASSLPLATAPTRQPATPASQPLASSGTPAPTPNATAGSGATSASASTPVPAAASPTLEPLPDPPLPRRLARDDGGSLTAAGRPKGQLAMPITSNDRLLHRDQERGRRPGRRCRVVASGNRRRGQSTGPGGLSHPDHAAAGRVDQDPGVHLQLHCWLQPDQLRLRSDLDCRLEGRAAERRARPGRRAQVDRRWTRVSGYRRVFGGLAGRHRRRSPRPSSCTR